MLEPPPTIHYQSMPPTAAKRQQLRRAELIIIVCLMSLPAILLLGLGIAGIVVGLRSGAGLGVTVGIWCLAIGSCFACVAIYAVIRLRRKVNP